MAIESEAESLSKLGNPVNNAEGAGKGYPEIGPLYLKMTEARTDDSPNNSPILPGALDIFGSLSMSSQFKVALHMTKGGVGDVLSKYLTNIGLTDDASRNEYYNFYCAETTLPGASFDTFQESGSRQGVIENFPSKRVYTPFNMTFYVDNDYRLIRLFEEWMNYINPVYSYGGISKGDAKGQGDAKNKPDFFRLRYPDSYKRIISVVKFERNFIKYPDPTTTSLYSDKKPKILSVPTLTYRMIDAFPTNITGMPVSYEGTTILKTTVDFSYSRYVIEKNDGDGPGDFY
jgi:hypothetical protein